MSEPATLLDRLDADATHLSHAARDEIVRLRGLPSDIQWDSSGKCPICYGDANDDETGHTPNCELAAALNGEAK